MLQMVMCESVCGDLDSSSDLQELSVLEAGISTCSSSVVIYIGDFIMNGNGS